MEPQELDDRKALLEIQAHLRGEIEWRSKTCMYTWYFLVVAAGAFMSFMYDKFRFSGVNGTIPDAQADLATFGFVILNLVWSVGLAYLLEKRSWISFIADYLREVVEERLYSENVLSGLHGWELHSEQIKKFRRYGVGEIETFGSIAFVLVTVACNVLLIGKFSPFLLFHAVPVAILVPAVVSFQSRHALLKLAFPERPRSGSSGMAFKIPDTDSPLP